MNRKTIIIGLLFAIIISLIAIYCLYCRHTVRCSLVFTYDRVESYGSWEVVSDSGYYSTKAFSDRYEKQTSTTLPDIFNQAGQTYILCYGHSLEKLFYHEVDRNGKAGDRHSFYNATAILRPADPKLVYVYLVEDSINIDRDIHSNNGTDTIIVQ